MLRPTLAEALDVPDLVWTGDWLGAWTGADGIDSAETCRLDPGQGKVLETMLDGPGMLSFWWRQEVDGECLESGGLEFAAINDFDGSFNTYLAMPNFGPCGYPDPNAWEWRQELVTLGPGPNLLRWYCSGYYGEGWPDTWANVDQVMVANAAHPMAPQILQESWVAEVPAGSNLTLTAWVMAYPIPDFQWFFNGRPIPGATNATLSLANVQPAQSGDYSVLAANSGGTITSAIARLTVVSIAGSVDLSFDPPRNAAYWQGCYALAQETNGCLLFGGHFIFPVSYVALARLLPDGGLDPNLERNIRNWDQDEGQVYAIKVQPDGRILLGGMFVDFDPTPRDGLARINPDGSLDESFDVRFEPPIDRGCATRIQALVLQADGRILIGGRFTHVNGVERPGLARLNPDGSLDAHFQPTLSLPPAHLECSNYWNVSLALQRDGKILVGTRIASPAPAPRQIQLIRLQGDGRVDPTLRANPPVDVGKILVQPDGRILIGSGFSDGLSQEWAGVARLNIDGSLDPGFQVNQNCYLLALAPDGQVLVSGLNTLAQINPDGSVNTRFQVLVNGWVSAALVQQDGDVVIGGLFTEVNGVARPGLARLHGNLVTPQHPVAGDQDQPTVASDGVGFMVVWRDLQNV